MRPLAFDAELDDEVEAARKAIRWELRDKHEVARRRWDDLVAGGGLGPAIEARVLLAWASLVDEGSKEPAGLAAQLFEALRVAGDLWDSSEGFDGSAKGVLGAADARFLAEWLVPESIRRAMERGDLELATTGASLAKELAVGRQLERGYRGREEPWGFDGVSLGILHGVVEAKFARPLRLAARTGARIAGAPEHALTLAEGVGEAAGMAAGYYVVLSEDWDETVQEKAALRRRLIEDGQRAVGDLQTSIGLVGMQDLGYFLGSFDRWAEDLWEAFEGLRSG